MIKSRALILVILLCISFSLFQACNAKKTIGDASSAMNIVAEGAGVPKDDLNSRIAFTINTLFAVVGIIFFGLMVYAGMRWLTSRGDDEKVKKAQGTLIGSSIGLVIIVSSFAISNLIVTKILTGSTGSGGSGGGEGGGCCFDQVQADVDNPLTASFPWWTVIMVNSEEECRAIGENANNVSDELYGPGTWKFVPGENTSATCDVMLKEWLKGNEPDQYEEQYDKATDQPWEKEWLGIDSEEWEGDTYDE